MVFTAAPAVELVTLTITVQPPAGITVPLASTKFPAPAVAVTPGRCRYCRRCLMVMPAGKVSVRALVRAMAPPLVLPMVTVRLVVPPLARLPTAKALVMVGRPPPR